MRIPVRIGRSLAVLTSCAVLTAGCATQQEQLASKDQLARARAVYERARADAYVQSYAPLALIEAEKTLQAASEASVWSQRHLGYLAEKKAQIALTIAEGRRAERDAQQLNRETAEILAERRDREAKLARAQTEAKARELERAQAEIEARARQIEEARARMEAQARELERARGVADVRAQEIEAARRAAEVKAREAEQARLQAELKAREVEQARLQTEAKQRELEQARRQTEARAREVEQARAMAEQLAREVSELKAKQTDRGVVLTMGDVLFGFGKADLSPGATRSIDKLAVFLEQHQNRNLLIEGHTDNVGSDEYNRALSEKRAQAVQDHLVARGVSPERIAIKGYGKQYPEAPNDTPSGRQQNRRVEIVILNEGVAPDTAFR